MAPAILIGRPKRTAQLKARVSTHVKAIEFSDDDVGKALQAIIERQPSHIVLDHRFATSPHGAALIIQVRQESAIGHTDILLGVDNGDEVSLIPLAVEAIIPSPNVESDDTSPVDFRGTRRATRSVLRMGVLINLDGDPATVLDMSRMGAQVLFSRTLRPSQRVRV